MAQELRSFLGLTRYEWRLFLIRFIVLGLCGYVVEVLFTGAHRFIDSAAERGLWWALTNLGQATKANTGIMAFFVYSWAAFPLTFLLPTLRRWTRSLQPHWLAYFLRTLTLALLFMAIEFIVGFLGIYVLGFPWESMWDYRGYFLNVLGVVTFSFLPAWWVAAVVGEWLHDRLLQVDDILANPNGFSVALLSAATAQYEERCQVEGARKALRRKLVVESKLAYEYLEGATRTWNRGAVEKAQLTLKKHINSLQSVIEHTNSVTTAAAVAFEVSDLRGYAARLVTAMIEGGIYG